MDVALRPGAGKAIPTAFLAAVMAAASLAMPASARSGACSNRRAIDVPGAAHQDVYCLEDLTTHGTLVSGRTNYDDWEGLQSSRTKNPTGVPGIQVDGYFPDSSRSNNDNGYGHDSQFVIRLPAQWNGKLVITGAPGVRAQYANDFIIGDWVLWLGY